MSMQEIQNRFGEQLNDIIAHGKFIGFDFENMNEDTLKTLLDSWIKSSGVFAESLNMMSTDRQKNLLNIK